MTSASLTSQPLDLAAMQSQVNRLLGDFLDSKVQAAETNGLPKDIPHALRDFLDAGGKRLRPLLCLIGWHAAGGAGSLMPILKSAASLEMFHAFCLIHDDIMDHSATRRGKPTVHRALAAHHRDVRTPGAADDLGTSAAILTGDLALAWSDELLHTAGLTADQLTAVLPLIDLMRTEAMYGQYLDICATGQPIADVEDCLKIVCYKTAKYTVERPLHIGAALAGGGAAVRSALSAFALPIGEAFQLRDDLLGVFGDPQVTGKSRLADLRDGKRTVLIALALHRAAPGQQALLTQLVGNPDLDESDAARIRDVLRRTGARDMTERMIEDRRIQADRALERSSLSPSALSALRRFGHAATTRAI